MIKNQIMKRKILFMLFLTLVSLCGTAHSIDIVKENNGHDGGMKMPSITMVSADYEVGIVTVEVLKYSGNASVYVYDANGMLVGASSVSIISNGIISLDLMSPASNVYTLYIILDNAVYSGNFQP